MHAVHIAAAADRPDRNLSPGHVRTDVPASAACTTKWGKDRRFVTAAMKARVLAAYHMTPAQCPSGKMEIDHVISRELLGADVERNLWPQCYEKPVAGKKPRDSAEWGAHKKDRLENFLHREVCAGRLELAAAQRAIARDWIATYRKYLGEPAL